MVVANAPIPAKAPHKHAALIKAWADGYEIEFKTILGYWTVVPAPVWSEDEQYRIKQTPPKNKEMDALIVLSPHAGLMLCDAAPDEANCKLVFDGATNKLVHVTVKASLEALKQSSEAFDSMFQGDGSLAALKRLGGR